MFNEHCMPVASSPLAPMPNEGRIDRHTIDPSRFLGVASKVGERQPQVEQHVLKKIFLIVRRFNAGSHHLQHEAKMILHPALELLSVCLRRQTRSPISMNMTNERHDRAAKHWFL